MSSFRRSLAAIALAALCTVPAYAATAGSRNGADLPAVAGASSGAVFADAMKQATPWSSNQRLDLDRLGNVTSLGAGQTAESVVFAPGARYAAGDYTLSYAGKGTFAVVGGTIVERAPGRLVVRVAPSPTGLRLQLVATDPKDYAHDIRLIAPGYEKTAATQPFLTPFVRSLAGADALRFGGWARTDVAWSAVWPLRPTTGQFTQAGDSGVAPEYAIALANAAGKAPWFTIPVGATNYYVAGLADLVHRTLDPRLHPLFEYGSEVWRPGSAANGWARMAGTNTHLSGDPAAAALGWYSLRATQVFAIVQQTFGPDAGRVVRVLGVPSPDAGGAAAARAILNGSNAARHADALAVPLKDAGAQAALLARSANLRLATYAAATAPEETAYAARFPVRGVAPDAHYGFVASPPQPAGERARVQHAVPPPGKPNYVAPQDAGKPVLTGSLGTPLRDVDLSREGTRDWVHYGRLDASRVDRDQAATERIGDVAVVGAARAQRYSGTFDAFGWRDGHSTVSSQTGIAASGAGAGFSLTAPADTATRTLRVYVGTAGTTGVLHASLSDGSARPYAGAPLQADAEGVYTLVYRAASANQRLTVTYTATGRGMATLQAATLQHRGDKPSGSPSPALTFHYDNSRSGWNPNETVLTTANVASGGFGKVGTLNVDGVVLAQPLYVPNFTLPGSQGTHNLLIVATEHDTVYEYDADTLALLNSVSLGTSQSSGDVGCYDISPEYGVTDTPVIDLSTNTIYVVAATEPTQYNFHHTLHALDIGTLADQKAPVDINASTVMSNGNTISFDPQNQQTRTSLTESNGYVYVGVGSHCDNNAGNIVGWMLKYDQSLNQVASLPMAEDSASYLLTSIWMTGYASAVDSKGDIFSVTGNGAFDASSKGGRNHGESVVKMDPNLKGVMTWFTPTGWQNLNNGDTDFGSGGIMLLPAQQAHIKNVAVAMGKASQLFLLNQEKLGRLGHPMQTINSPGGGVWGGPAFYNGPTGQFVYYQTGGDVVRAYQVTVKNHKVNLAQSSYGNSGAGYGGSSPVVSSNGQNPGTGIVWLVQRNHTLTLEAYDATNLQNMLFSGAAGSWPNGNNNGFVTPLVANGRVYVPATGTVTVFGLP